MKKMLEEMEKEIMAWPGVTFHVKANKPHSRIVLSYDGVSRFLVYSNTEVDPRGIKNKIAELRRLLPNIGAAKQSGGDKRC